jgi:hypothetical protein
LLCSCIICGDAAAETPERRSLLSPWPDRSSAGQQQGWRVVRGVVWCRAAVLGGVLGVGRARGAELQHLSIVTHHRLLLLPLALVLPLIAPAVCLATHLTTRHHRHRGRGGWVRGRRSKMLSTKLLGSLESLKREGELLREGVC